MSEGITPTVSSAVDDKSKQQERAKLFLNREKMDPTQFSEEFLALFNDFSIDELAEVLCFITVESSQSAELEQALYEYISAFYPEDDRFQFVSIEVAGEPCDFITVVALTNVEKFTLPINPFIRRDPSKTYVGFHDTTFYTASQLEKKGLENPLSLNREFYVHPMRMFSQKYWDGDWLARLKSYGVRYLDPYRENVHADYEYKYPPLEVRQRDFRAARVAVILPVGGYRDRTDKSEKVDFQDQELVAYELHVGVDVPPECIVVTNIYHSLAAQREMIAEGYSRGGPFTQEYYIQPQIKEYADFGIDEQTGMLKK